MKKLYFASNIFVFVAKVTNIGSGYLGVTCFPSAVWQPIVSISVLVLVACYRHTTRGKWAMIFILICIHVTKLQENHGYSCAWEVIGKRMRTTLRCSLSISYPPLFLEIPIFFLCKLASRYGNFELQTHSN